MRTPRVSPAHPHPRTPVLSLLLAQALANAPVVTVGSDLVAGSPARDDRPASAWVPVLADCLEEARPGKLPVVDRSRAGVTSVSLKDDVEGVRSLAPTAVVIGVGSHEAPSGDPAVFRDQVEAVVKLLRADGGPQVYLVGLVAPVVGQLPAPDGQPVPEQAASDAKLVPWNEGLEKIASLDDGVWFVDLWGAWPREQAERDVLTTGGYVLTDPAHARVGAVICEQILANLRKRRK